MKYKLLVFTITGSMQDIILLYTLTHTSISFEMTQGRRQPLKSVEAHNVEKRCKTLHNEHVQAGSLVDYPLHD